MINLIDAFFIDAGLKSPPLEGGNRDERERKGVAAETS
jgi:hypothetical protein